MAKRKELFSIKESGLTIEQLFDINIDPDPDLYLYPESWDHLEESEDSLEAKDAD